MRRDPHHGDRDHQARTHGLATAACLQGKYDLLSELEQLDFELETFTGGTAPRCFLDMHLGPTGHDARAEAAIDSSQSVGKRRTPRRPSLRPTGRHRRHAVYLRGRAERDVPPGHLCHFRKSWFSTPIGDHPGACPLLMAETAYQFSPINDRTLASPAWSYSQRVAEMDALGR
ncbi:hypothetical protein AC20117_10580 [Arthrobacter crystallopoietes]|nr:hypothetical protein AC20117_10580 [Arthrobacter crystallopoietes]